MIIFPEVFNTIIWRLISTRAGPAALQFDYIMTLAETSFQDRNICKLAFRVDTGLSIQTTQKEPHRALIWSGLESVKVYRSSRSTELHSLSHYFQS